MRALPLGIAALGLLLALKIADTSGVLSARAEEAAAKTEAAPPAGDHAEAPAGDHAEAPATKPAAAETAADGPTASESDVLERLADRRKQLDARERDLDMREKLIGAAEKRVEERIVELKSIEGRIEEMFGKRTEQEEKQLADLVKMYETMKPVAAAAIFNTLEQGVLLDVMGRMKPAKAAPVLAAMTPERAQEVTVELARRYDIPATEDGATAPADPAAAPPSAGDPAPPGG
jgi:flagellar motility protein MotE (MotC chaperone)